MEGLLILIGIWLLDVVIKKVTASRKNSKKLSKPNVEQKKYPPQNSRSSESYYDSTDTERHAQNKKLEELIRQFEHAQEQAAQGNIEPATLSHKSNNMNIDEDEWMELQNLAKEIFDYDEVDAEFFEDTFGYSSEEALYIIQKLQMYNIISPVTEDGSCLVLVHNLDELKEIVTFKEQFKIKQREKLEKQKEDAEQERLLIEKQKELDRQKELQQKIEELNQKSSIIENIQNSEPAKRKFIPISIKSKTEAQKGFIWAKILDEPRFKKRWSRASR